MLRRFAYLHLFRNRLQLQPRIHQQDANAIAKLAQKSPVHFYAFDLLYLDGYDLRRVALSDRKRALAGIVKPHPLLRLSDHFEAGTELLEAARWSPRSGRLRSRASSTPR